MVLVARRVNVAGLAVAAGEWDIHRAVASKLATVNPGLAEAYAAHLTQALRAAGDTFGDETAAAVAAVVRGRRSGGPYARVYARAYREGSEAIGTATTATSTATSPAPLERGRRGWLR